MDKGYYLLKALGFDEMARRARSTKERTTSKDCLEHIIQTAKDKGIWETEHDMAMDILKRMALDLEDV